MPRPKQENKRVSATVHPELYDALEELANRQGRTMAHLVAYALENWVGEIAPKLYPLTTQVNKNYPLDEDE